MIILPEQINKAMQLDVPAGVQMCVHDALVVDLGDAAVLRVAGHLCSAYSEHDDEVVLASDEDVFTADMLMTNEVFRNMLHVCLMAYTRGGVKRRRKWWTR